MSVCNAYLSTQQRLSATGSLYRKRQRGRHGCVARWGFIIEHDLQRNFIIEHDLQQRNIEKLLHGATHSLSGTQQAYKYIDFPSQWLNILAHTTRFLQIRHRFSSSPPYHLAIRVFRFPLITRHPTIGTIYGIRANTQRRAAAARAAALAALAPY